MTRKWLRDYREGKKLTQDQTATLAGIARSYYTHIEQGTKTPSVEVAKSLGKTLGFNWVIFFENECSLKEQKRAAV